MGVLLAFIIALLISILFLSGRREESSIPLLIFFLVLFLAGIAGQFWLIPFGPLIWGVAWMPLLFFILIVALLFAAPFPQRITKTDKQEKGIPEAATVQLFIWLLICVLAIAIFVGVYRS
jgi:hypothetical protein